ncbi:MAG: hypothetical protein QM755_23790 [Luteolibacter sp.]
MNPFDETIAAAKKLAEEKTKAAQEEREAFAKKQAQDAANCANLMSEVALPILQKAATALKAQSFRAAVEQTKTPVGKPRAYLKVTKGTERIFTVDVFNPDSLTVSYSASGQHVKTEIRNSIPEGLTSAVQKFITSIIAG